MTALPSPLLRDASEIAILLRAKSAELDALDPHGDPGELRDALHALGVEIVQSLGEYACER